MGQHTALENEPTRRSRRKILIVSAIAAAAVIGGSLAADAAVTGQATAPAHGAYLYATASNPVNWGCENPATGGLVGGRFYKFAGLDAPAPTDRYPGCATWAKVVAWDSHSLPESTRVSTAGLAIDGAPGDHGNGGSGGWGWNDSASAPVTSLDVGTNASLTVTALSDGSIANGSMTVSYDPDDFTYVSASDGTCTAVPNAEGVVTCALTDMSHTVKSVGFTFAPNRPNAAAVVSATVELNGSPEIASATFPVEIKANASTASN